MAASERLVLAAALQRRRRCILKQAKHGTRVVYVPGSHDEAFRDYVGLNFGGVEVLPKAIHLTADSRKLLIVHGDEFDGFVIYTKSLAFLGDHAYTVLLKFNRTVNAVRRWFKLPYWSLAARLKKKVKNAVAFISSFEEAVVAAECGSNGVVCGHVHSAEIRQIGDVTNYNDGDWFESCTALIEHADGTMAIIDWAAKVRDEKVAQRREPCARPIPRSPSSAHSTAPNSPPPTPRPTSSSFPFAPAPSASSTSRH